MSAWRHHWDVLKEALRADREWRRTFVPSREADFLPAALEVAERPVSPTARMAAWDRPFRWVTLYTSPWPSPNTSKPSLARV